ncbi:MAG: TIGR00269 family protein [Methanobacteriota archaeon]
MKCDRCGRDAVTTLRYAGRRLCADHFTELAERRAKAEFRAQMPRLPEGATIAVALSGGKDSAAALHLTKLVYGPVRSAQILAVTIDEGIAGYRADTIAEARALAERLDVAHRVLRFEDEFGTTTDALAAAGRETGRAPCASCGVMRRTLLNRAAREVGAAVLVTGHNLDDLAQSILMNVVRGDTARLARLGPHETPVDGLVPRVFPLRTTPEQEVALYAFLRGLPVAHDACPHARDARRGRFRTFLLDLEEDEPGTRHAILRAHERLAPALRVDDASPPAPCPRCGEPATGGVCRACAILDELSAVAR